MRKNGQWSSEYMSKAAGGARRGKGAVMRLALAVLLFALVFGATLFAVTGGASLIDPNIQANIDGVAEAKTPTTQYNHETVGTYSVLPLNSADGIAHFGMNVQSSGMETDFKWFSKGWGLEKGYDGQTLVFWVEAKFSGTLLTKVKTGKVYFTASASGDLATGNNDNMAIAVGYLGIHDDPSYTLGSGGSWQKGREDYFAVESSWTDSDKPSLTAGSSSAKNATYISASATGLRIACYLDADGGYAAYVNALSVTYYESDDYFPTAIAEIKESDVTKDGYEIASGMNDSSNDSTYKSSFGYTSDMTNDPKTNIRRLDDSGKGWGFKDWKCGGDDQVVIFWAEYTFDSNLQNLIKLGLISWKLSIDTNFAAGKYDESAVAVSYIGVHDNPMAYHVSQSRSGNDASWTKKSKDYYAWQSTWINGQGSFSNGSDSFSCGTEIDSSATGIRLVFAVMSDGAIDGSLYNISLKLYRAWDGNGTSTSDPFKITERKDLITLSHKVRGIDGEHKCPAGAQTFSGKYFMVTKDIEMGTSDFTPIGNNTEYFSGKFDGNNCTINNLKVNVGSEYAGLFAFVGSGVEIKSLTFFNPTIKSTYSSAAVVAGRADGTVKIQDITVTNGSVTCTHQAGAIVGYKNAGKLTISNCQNNGCSITTSGCSDAAQNYRNSTGGIVGLLYAGNDTTNTYCAIDMQNCSNSGTVTATCSTANQGTGTGGLIGYSNITTYTRFFVKNCTNTGKITGEAAVGGIVGYAAASTRDISSAYGICGCTNTGKVRTTDAVTLDGVKSAYLGGIIGYAGATLIYKCYNSGQVTTAKDDGTNYSYSNEVGGIAGNTDGHIYFVYNCGVVDGSNAIGGIVGKTKSTSSTIYYAYSDGEVKGLWGDGGAHLGPIIGNNTTRGGVYYSWKLPGYKLTKANNKGTEEGANGITVLNIGSAYTSAFKYYPATSNRTTNQSITSWTDITNSSYDCKGYLRVSATIEEGYFFETTRSNTGGTYNHPYTDYSWSGLNSNGTSYDVNLVYMAVATASASDVYYVGKKAITSKINISKPIYDGNSVKASANMVTSPSGTDTRTATNYYISFIYNYKAVGESTYNKQVDSVRNAGSYNIDVRVNAPDMSGNNDIVLGHKGNNLVDVKPRMIYLEWNWVKDTVQEPTRNHNVFVRDDFVYSGTYRYNGLQTIFASSNWGEVNMAGDWHVSGDGGSSFWDNALAAPTPWFRTGSNLNNFVEFDSQSIFKAFLVRKDGKQWDGYDYFVEIRLRSNLKDGNYTLVCGNASDNDYDSKIVESLQWHYTIKPRNLIKSETFSDGANALKSSYTYNNAHQGLSALTLDLAPGDNVGHIVKEVSVTGDGLTQSGTYNFAGAINVGTYTVKIVLQSDTSNLDVYRGWNYCVDRTETTAGGQTTYQYKSEKTYTWEIVQREISLTYSWTDAFKNAATTGLALNAGNAVYNGYHQGIEIITIVPVANNKDSGLVSGHFANDIIEITGVSQEQVADSPDKIKLSGAVNVKTYNIQFTVLNKNYKLNNQTYSASWTITTRVLNVSANWSGDALGASGDALGALSNKTNNTYTFNCAHQGLIMLKIDNLISGINKDNLTDDVITIQAAADTSTKVTIEEFESSTANLTISDSVNVGHYAVTLGIVEKNIGNYQLKLGTGTASNQPIEFTWDINVRSFDPYITFAYFYDGQDLSNRGNTVSVLSGTANKFFDLNCTYDGSNQKTALIFSRDLAGIFVGDGNGANCFVMWQNVNGKSELPQSVYASHSRLVINTDFTAKYSTTGFDEADNKGITSFSDLGAALDPDDMTVIYLTVTGQGNYEGTIYVKIAVLPHDFSVREGNRYDDATNIWGSKDNPYVIENEEHMMRLMAIVNGEVRHGDSVSGTIDNVPFVAAAQNITYAGAYFELKQGVQLTLTSQMGFVPIGNMSNVSNMPAGPRDKDSRFSGTFDGNYQGTDADNNARITLTLGAVNALISDNYVGLFGYLDGATIKNVNINSTIYAASNYVGGIAGHAVDTRLEGKINCAAMIDVFNASAQYTGGLIGFYESGTEDGKFGAINVTGDSNYLYVSGSVSGTDYVGGLFGMLQNVFFVKDAGGNYYQKMDALAASVDGNNYVGGIAGKWIVPSIGAQNAGGAAEGGDIYVNFVDFPIEANQSSINVESSGMYCGGIAGWLDATNSGGVVVTPKVTAASTADLILTVKGSGFVGGLFGVFEGGGYKKNSTNASGSDSRIVIKQENIRLIVSAGSGAYVVGGMFGYVGGAGVIFGGIYTDTKDSSPTGAQVKIDAKNAPEIIGGIAGIIGNNATFEADSNSVGGNGGTSGATIELSRSYQGKNFVGAVAGYVAYSAGSYVSGDEASGIAREFGNGVDFVVSSSVTGTYFVGGLFGAVGKIDYSANWTDKGLGSNIFSGTNTYTNSKYIENILNLGVFADGSPNADPSSVRLTNADTFGAAKSRMIFTGTFSTGTSAVFVGGIVGYAGASSLLAFSNNTVNANPGGKVEDFENYLDFYVKITITGKRNLGGIAGYVEPYAHLMNRVVVVVGYIGNIPTASANVSSYVGGMFGYFGDGNINNSVVATSVSAISASTSILYASEYAGGLVGRMENQASISNSYSTGVNYNSSSSGRAVLSATIGGIVGSTAGAANASSSWAYHVATLGTTYSNVSPNTNGKYIVISADVLDSDYFPKAVDLAKSAGILSNSVDGGIAISTGTWKDANRQEGNLSFAVKTPNNNNQIAFYDVSGNNKMTNNKFDKLAGQSINDKPYVYARISNSSSSMMVLSTAIVYKDPVAKETPSADEIASSYRPPAGAKYASNTAGYYMAGVTHTVANKAVTGVSGDVYFKYGSFDGVQVGHLDKTFSAGSEDSPFLIWDKTDWNTFASAVRGGDSYVDTNGKQKYVKLMADISDTVNLASEAAGSSTKFFSGVFDGNGHTIDVTYTGNENGISLFPYADGATFKNLTVSGSITAISTSEKVDDTTWWDKGGCGIAAFVGSPKGSVTFENCTNKANITGTQAVGGFIGNYEDPDKAFTMISCVNEGNITSLFGTTKEGYNHNKGTGGIIGSVSKNIEITIESCRNKGNITGGQNVGGIIGLNIGELNIYNCANTGEIFANLGDSTIWTGATNTDKMLRRYGYAGGLVGKISGTGFLNMYASYNSGTVKATANIGGGLVGSIGQFSQEQFKAGAHDQLDFGGASTIAYCYNTGSVYVGSQNPVDLPGWNGPGTMLELYGACGGGIVGVWGAGNISYCYNTGTITTTGYTVGGWWAWSTFQIRIGGIAGQTEPQSGSPAHFNYCYNIGQIVSDTKGNKDPQFGAGISGYTDSGDEENYTQVVASNCYSLKNCVYVKEKGHYGLDGNIDGGGSQYFKTGDEVETLADLTAYMANESSSVQYVKAQKMIGGGTRGSVASMILPGESGDYIVKFDDTSNSVTYANVGNDDYEEKYKNAELNGYIYIYGCLPTLAMFAVGTKEGLSMLSVSYGQDENGDWVGALAGSKQSPYIIKDGVDLLGMSALANASSGSNYYYTFHDKYIEIAHSDSSGSNNIDNLNVTSINMNTLKNNTSTQGKNYFLFERGAANNASDFGSTTGTRDKWKTYNYCYNGLNGFVNGADLSTFNYIPVGYMGNDGNSQYLYRFEGSFNGRNASITNLKTSIYHASRAYAGLFGKTQNAAISNVTLTGASIKAYYTGTSDGAAYGSVAGGIVAWAGGGTTITGCSVKGCSIYAYSDKSNAGNSSNTDKANSYVGGIAGVAFTGTSSGTELVFSNDTVEISGCTVTDNGSSSSTSRIYGYGSNIGGIVGLAAGKPVAHANAISTRTPLGKGDASTTYINLNDNTLSNAITISSLGNTKHTEANTGIAGIVGVIDGAATVGLSGNILGISGNANTGRLVKISGINKIGGMIGYSLGNTTVGGTVGGFTRVTVTNTVAAIYSPDATFGTAVGGVVGYGDDIYFHTITFQGTVEVDSSITEPVNNIGGIIGYMDAGSMFVAGETIDVSQSAYIYVSSNSGNPTNNLNIGGVVGYCNGATFGGSYTITPNIYRSSTEKTKLDANNVGGFIGYNNGETYINANQTAISNDATVINIHGSIFGNENVGGFIGYNVGTVGIGLDSVNGAIYDGELTINIGSSSSVTNIEGKNYVGGLIGANAPDASVRIQKGRIQNYANISGVSYIGGVIGANLGTLNTGGSSYNISESGEVNQSLMMSNRGTVTGNFSAGAEGEGEYIGGVIGYHAGGALAGYFVNFNSVKGKKFVGGSVGYIGRGGEINVYTNADGEALGDTAFYNCGMVTGIKYVGGAVGAALGTIKGTTQYQVTFACTQIDGATGAFGVDGENYVGGVIGILAGTVTYGEFINNAPCTITESNEEGTLAGSLGGAIGMIGISEKAYDDIPETDRSAPIIRYSQFEYDVMSLASGSEEGGSSASSDFVVKGEALGVGGVIGVITVETTFDYTNNFFVTGNVVATDSDFVGGVVGFVRGNNVELRNILLDHTEVTGQQYVGGVVGGISGTGVKITNSYNLHGTVTAGEGVQSKFKGGIVGGFLTDEIAAVTDASSSYWILDKALDGGELTSEYIQNAVDNNIWMAGTAGENSNIGSKSTGWLFVVASDLAMVQNGDHKDGVHTTGFYSPAPSGNGVIGLHAPGGHVEDNYINQLHYWKRIANNYSIAERTTQLYDEENNPRTFSDGTAITAANEPLQSFISLAGTDQYGKDGNQDGNVAIGWLYAAASSAVPGGYLTVSTQSANDERAITGFGDRTVVVDEVTYTTNISVKHANVNTYAVGDYANTYKNAVTNGSYDLTYIAINANNRDASDASNIKFENHVGNIAIYYRKASDVESGKAKVIDFGSVPYNGTSQKPEMTSAILSKIENSGFKAEFGTGKHIADELSSATDSGTAGTYGYLMRLARITDDPAGTNLNTFTEDNNGHNFTDAGIYEGYLDIYLFDDEGKAKVVGSVQFVYQITPAEVKIVSSPATGSYGGGKTQSTDFKFDVNGTEWGDFISGIEGNAENYYPLLNSLKLYFAYSKDGESVFVDSQQFNKDLIDKLKPSQDIPISDNMKVRLALSSVVGYKYMVSNITASGKYQLASRSTNVYTSYTFANGSWTATDTNCVMTDDRNYVLMGRTQTTGEAAPGDGTTEGDSQTSADPKYYESEGVRAYTYFEMKKLELEYEYDGGYKTYDTSQAEFNFVTFRILNSDVTLNTTELFGILNSAGIRVSVNNEIKDFATGTQVLAFRVSVGPDAGSYNIKLSGDFDENGKISTDNCEISRAESSNLNATYTIYQQQIRVGYTYFNDKEDNQYEYNSKEQGVKQAQLHSYGTSINYNWKSGTEPTAELTYKQSGSTSQKSTTIKIKNVIFNIESTPSIDAGTYTLTITLPSKGNYTFNSGNSVNKSSTATITWVIDPYEINITVKDGGSFAYDGTAHQIGVAITGGKANTPLTPQWASTNGQYRIAPFGDDVVTFDPKFSADTGTSATENGFAVNCGKYTLDLDETIKTYKYENTPASNYKITTEGSGSLTITQANVTLNWQENDSFTYNGNYQGRSLADPTMPTGFKIVSTGVTYTSDHATGTVTITFTNAANKQETFTVTLQGESVGVGAAMKDVGSYTVVRAENVSVSGENAAGSTDDSHANYIFTGDWQATYYITPVELTDFTVTGGETSKVYDGTTNVNNLGAVQFTGLMGSDSLAKDTDYTIRAAYDFQNVTGTSNGATKITYTVTLTGNVKNYTLSKTKVEIGATITARPLTVTLNLKSGAATKVYDGDESYGGDGVTSTGSSSSSAVRSKRYIAGNGFTVSNFVESGIQVTAVFRETGNDRNAFDAFVNHLGTNGQDSNKQLVFTVKSTNYTLTYSGDFAPSSSGQTLTLSSTNITITPKPITAVYDNTAQSYVNPDNSYTKQEQWKDVGGTLRGVVNNDKVGISITNDWKSGESNSGEYHKHTVIRGSASSKLLKVELVSTASGTDTDAQRQAYQNYSLKNYPILTIGYFVSDKAFEIGSLASLLIATYYYSISGEGSEFVPVLPAVEEVIVCSEKEYANNSTEDRHSKGEFETWDEYFAYLAEQGHDVFFDGTKWVYYQVDETAQTPTYTSFKLIKDISGVFTEADITILDNMFYKVEYNDDGTPTGENVNAWGYGQNGKQMFLTNVLKGKAGDTVTIINSLFDNFTGEFDGNGYVINGFNLMGGVDSSHKENAGLFAIIGSGAEVKDLHLRNVNVVASGVTNVGALAGTASADITNVSVQGMFNITGGTNVGGVVGNLTADMSQVIAMGTINTNGTASVGSIAGASTGTITSAVSMMYIWATGATSVGGIVGSGSAGDNTTYLLNSVWNNKVAITGGISYDTLYNGSVSGYSNDANAYYNKDATKNTTYDVLSDVTTENMVYGENESAPNPRQSMRLCDIIDVYLLQYSISATPVESGKYNAYAKSTTSWLVGDAKGTTRSPIIIANQQGVPLLRELRFATFQLAADVYMYSTYKLTTYQGAFFGTIYNNKSGKNEYDADGYHIYIKNYDNKPMFEKMPDGALPLAKY